MDPHPKQTFGIELEFILVVNPDSKFRDHFGLGANDDIKQAVHKRLEQDQSIKLHPFGIFARGNEDGYSKWSVVTDTSVFLTTDQLRTIGDTWTYASVELVSRIFDYHADEWDIEITTVLSRLTAAFNRPELADSCRIVVNHTCGLHVHVAKGPLSSRPFHLQTLKNLWYLVVGFERVIDEAHDSKRVRKDRGESHYESHYCQGPSYIWKWGPTTHPLQAIAQFDKAVQERADMAHAGNVQHTCAYNFDNCFRQRWYQNTPCPPQTGTVEFRQHRGTLDSDEVIAWIEVVTALMSWAEVTWRLQALHFVAENLERPDYRFPDLLRDIGAGPGLVEYYEAALAPKVEWERVDESIQSVPDGSAVQPLLAAIEYSRWDAKNFYALRYAIGSKILSGQLGYFPRKMLDALPDHYWTKVNEGLLLFGTSNEGTIETTFPEDDPQSGTADSPDKTGSSDEEITFVTLRPNDDKLMQPEPCSLTVHPVPLDGYQYALRLKQACILVRKSIRGAQYVSE